MMSLWFWCFFSFIVVTGATDGIGKAYAEDVGFLQNFTEKIDFMYLLNVDDLSLNIRVCSFD